MSSRSIPPRRSDMLRRGDVDGSDLTILNGAWRCTSPCPDCRADLNNDGVVNAADMTILLGNWNAECECFGCPAPVGAGERFASSGASADGASADTALDDAVTMLGFDSIAALVTWLQSASPEEAEQATSFIHVYLEARE